MNTDALQLAARFALPPNSYGYCGRDTAPEKFKKCFIHGECTGVEKELTKFIVLYPYIKTIAKIIDKSLFSHEVIETYCLGNDLLKKAKPEHYYLLLENFLDQGVPNWLVKELKENPPKKFIPSHLFQVLHVGVGKASGAVPFNLDSINNCMIRWGKVQKVEAQSLAVELNSLEKPDEAYSLTLVSKSLEFNSEFVPNLKIGDTVAVHWNQVIKILDEREAKNLTFWTKEVLKIVN